MSRPTDEQSQPDPTVSSSVATVKTATSSLEPSERESPVYTPLRKRTGTLVSFLIVALTVLSITVYFAIRDSRPASETAAPAAGDQQAPPIATPPDDSLISRIFGSEQSSAENARQESLLLRAERMTARLLLAALLAALLAFRPHRYPGAVHRNPYVAQTQILLAVVAAALMMIVADNAARAFGIFAAASLVRFRTNIRDPKEITVLLINLAIGLAAGVGRWELAIILSLFVLITLWVLEHYESRQVIRSMQLKVKTHNVVETDEIMRRIFERHRLNVEVRELDREDEKNPIGRIVYYVNVSPVISTDRLSEEIFASDPHNLDTVEWHQKKSVSYTYR